MKPKTQHRAARSVRSEPGKNKTAVSMLKAVTLGLLVTAALLLLFSFVLSRWELPFSLLNPLVTAALVLGGGSAGFSVARMLRENGLLLGGLCGAVLFLLLAMASAWSQSAFGMPALIKLVICTVSGAIGGVLGVNLRKKRK